MRTERNLVDKRFMQQVQSFKAKVEQLEDGKYKGTTEMGGEQFEVVHQSREGVMSGLRQQIVDRLRTGGLPTLTQSHKERTVDKSSD